MQFVIVSSPAENLRNVLAAAGLLQGALNFVASVPAVQRNWPPNMQLAVHFYLRRPVLSVALGYSFAAVAAKSLCGSFVVARPRTHTAHEALSGFRVYIPSSSAVNFVNHELNAVTCTAQRQNHQPKVF